MDISLGMSRVGTFGTCNFQPGYQNLYQLQALGRQPGSQGLDCGVCHSAGEPQVRPPEAVPGGERAASGRLAPEHSYLGSENLVITTTSPVTGKPGENTWTGPPVSSRQRPGLSPAVTPQQSRPGTCMSVHPSSEAL